MIDCINDVNNMPIDPEDVMDSVVWIIFCVAKNGAFYADRVYKSRDIAQKRIDYMNCIFGERGVWQMVYSQLCIK